MKDNEEVLNLLVVIRDILVDIREHGLDHDKRQNQIYQHNLLMKKIELDHLEKFLENPQEV
jgi:hypothetical protein